MGNLTAGNSDKAQFRQEIGDLKAENAELRQKVADLEASQQERQAGSDRASDTAGDNIDRADAEAIDNRLDDEAGREGNRAVARPQRSAFSPEAADFWRSAADMAGTLGILPPGTDLVLGGDATRRAIEKMSPEEQSTAMRMADTAGIAFSSMSPGTAVVAIGASILGPAAYAKVRNIVRKMTHKELI